MSEKEPGQLRFLLQLCGKVFMKGCPSYTRQLDPGIKKVVDMCAHGKYNCQFYDGQYQTRGDTELSGNMSGFDFSIGKGSIVGLCRLQKDAVRLGCITLFDKKWLRPTPVDTNK